MRYPERPTVRRGGDYGARIERLVTWLGSSYAQHRASLSHKPTALLLWRDRYLHIWCS